MLASKFFSALATETGGTLQETAETQETETDGKPEIETAGQQLGILTTEDTE